ncbi:hypothetical protein [Pseudomonas chlororaphis]|uniref:hypothetical protein n=1 Tax=Pseudomonas chlororaphis TaxID=587753 RepID=UPI00240874A4|nr:hypothetical protein [Pseudomonas chlororaphis]
MMNSHKALLALPLALFICATANATGLPEPKAGVLEAAAAADVSRAIYADFLQNLDNKGVKLEQEGEATREAVLPWTFYPMFSDRKNCAWTIKPPVDKPGVLELFKITRNGAQVCGDDQPVIEDNPSRLGAITPTRVIVGPRSCLWLLDSDDDGMPHLMKLTNYNNSSLCTRRPNQDPQ